MDLKKYIIIAIVAVLVVITFVGCSKKNNNEDLSNVVVETEKGKNDKNPVATITMEDGSIIKVELYPEIAPNTVRNFISLANSGFYNNLTFHRVIKNFMIQGGDPEGTGIGGPGYSIEGEFSKNGFPNELKHKKGVISMARSQNPNSAGSQFFIMHNDAPSLDGSYAAFGKVIEGIDVVDKIANVETNSQDKPTKDVKIKNISVETFGVNYKEPEKVK